MKFKENIAQYINSLKKCKNKYINFMYNERFIKAIFVASNFLSSVSAQVYILIKNVIRNLQYMN